MAETYEIRFLDLEIEPIIAITDYEFERSWNYKTIIVNDDEDDLMRQYVSILDNVSDTACFDGNVDLRIKIIPQNKAKECIYIGYHDILYGSKKLCQNSNLRNIICNIINKYSKDTASIKTRKIIDNHFDVYGQSIKLRDYGLMSRDKRIRAYGANIYGVIRAFYKYWNVPMGNFAKQLSCFFLLEDLRFNAIQVLPIIGAEYIIGALVPKNISLGEYLVNLNNDTNQVIDSITASSSLFWQDSQWQKYYMQTQFDSLDFKIKRLIIENNDLKLYDNLINEDIYGKEFMYAVYMIDKCNYSKSYYDLYLCLQKYYATNNFEFGPYAKEISLKFLTQGAMMGDTLCRNALINFEWY